MDHADIVATLEQALSQRGLTASAVSRRATGQKDAIRRIVKGHRPSVARLSAIARELDLEFYIGPRRDSSRVTPLRPIDSLAKQGLAPVADRELAELLAAICRRWESLPPSERAYLAADIWAAGGAGLSAQRSALRQVVAWLGWRVVDGGAAPEVDP